MMRASSVYPELIWMRSKLLSFLFSPFITLSSTHSLLLTLPSSLLPPLSLSFSSLHFSHPPLHPFLLVTWGLRLPPSAGCERSVVSNANPTSPPNSPARSPDRPFQPYTT